MGHMARLRFLEKAPGCGHSDDPTELAFWNPDKTGNILDQGCAVQRNTSWNLTVAKPLYTGQQLHLSFG